MPHERVRAERAPSEHSWTDLAGPERVGAERAGAEWAGAERVRAELPGAPASVREARTLVRTALRGWDLDSCQDTASLLVSELATNAVLHARSDFAVEVSHTQETVRVAVSDRSAAAVSPRGHSALAGTGRGLAMIELMSSSWGTDRGVPPYVKSVWFEVPAHEG